MKGQKDTNPNEPKKRMLYTIDLNPEQMKKLGTWLDKQLWAPYAVDHAAFAFKGNQVNVVAYKSGKVVIQGKKTEDFVHFVLEPEITQDARMGYDEVHHPEWYEAHAGLDESGKGDFFGPIVSTCVIADGEMVKHWVDKGIRDSKKITSDKAVLQLEEVIRKTSGVVIKTTFANMVKYNELYTKFGSNLNRLLAWLHAKSLEEALKERNVPWGMLDQFSKQPLVQNYFKDSDFSLKMQTKAEADPVVAAASIIARATYLHQMEKLSQAAGEKLQKGVNAKVKEQAKMIIEKQGPEALKSFAKMHFRTAFEVLGLPVPEKVEWKKYNKDNDDESE